MQIPLLYNFVNGAIRAKDALEEDDFVHFLVNVCLLFDGLYNFLEILFLTKIFDAAEGEMRNEILSITLITNVIEGS